MHAHFSSSDHDDTEPRLPSIVLNEHDPAEALPLPELTQVDTNMPEFNPPANHSQLVPALDISTIPTLPGTYPDVSTMPTLTGTYPDVSTMPTSPSAYPDLPSQLSLPIVSAMFRGAPPPPQTLSEGPLDWYKHQEPGKKLWLGGGAIVMLLTIVAYLFMLVALNHVPAMTTIITPHPTPDTTLINQRMPTSTIPITITPTQKPASAATPIQIILPPAQHAQPTVSPAHPTQPPTDPTQPPTHPTQPTQPPADPTQPPTHPTQPTQPPTNPQPPQPTQPPMPIPTPTQISSINGNPWGYNFNPGMYITNPPTAFCSYFSCIRNFFFGHGYVVECTNGQFSLWGGTRIACFFEGGVVTPLYSH